MTHEEDIAPMTDEHWTALGARAGAATPGPWHWNSYSLIFAATGRGHVLAYDDHDDDEGQWNAPIARIWGGPQQREHGGEHVQHFRPGDVRVFEGMRRTGQLPVLDTRAHLGDIPRHRVGPLFGGGERPLTQVQLRPLGV